MAKNRRPFSTKIGATVSQNHSLLANLNETEHKDNGLISVECQEYLKLKTRF